MPARVNEIARDIVVDFDPFSDDYIVNPYPFHQRMREVAPVVWIDVWECWGVARDAIVKEVLNDPGRFGSNAGVGYENLRKEPPWRPLGLLLEADPPAHGPPRSIITRVLSPVALRRLRAELEHEAERLVDVSLVQGTFDAVPNLAQSFPIKVFADAIGIRQEGRAYLLDWGNMLFNTIGPKNSHYSAAMANAAEVAKWVMESCRRENLTDGRFGIAVHDLAAELGHDEEYGALLVRNFLSAGIDTTIHAISNALWLFAEHPDQWDIVRSDTALIKPAFEEVLRFESPFQTYFRTANDDTTLAGTHIRRDEKIMLSLGAANRDPEAWSKPDTFDVFRRPNGHLAFGSGIHACVGQMMARLEADVLLTALARRVSRIELAGVPVRQLHNTLRGFEQLPVRLIH
jgi:4-methoxybenzoate monooxygenase (O-demethylating)